MISWRTSRFLIFFFLILGSVVAISAAVKFIGPDFVDRWREVVLARVSAPATPQRAGKASPLSSPTPTAVTDGGHPAELPNFPPVHIDMPAQSPFDQGEGPAVYCGNCYAGL